jgi:hypothetical protein
MKPSPKRKGRNAHKTGKMQQAQKKQDDINDQLFVPDSYPDYPFERPEENSEDEYGNKIKRK